MSYGVMKSQLSTISWKLENLRPVPRSHRHSCEDSNLHQENCANARRIHVSWVINPLFHDPSGSTVEPSTPAQPVPGNHRRFCDVSTLYLGNCANTRQFHVFWVINPLFLIPLGNSTIVNPSTTYTGGHRRSCEVPTLYLENCANAHRIHVFLVINPLFLTPLGVL